MATFKTELRKSGDLKRNKENFANRERTGKKITSRGGSIWKMEHGYTMEDTGNNDRISPLQIYQIFIN